jgi:hypothetical protein
MLLPSFLGFLVNVTPRSTPTAICSNDMTVYTFLWNVSCMINILGTSVETCKRWKAWMVHNWAIWNPIACPVSGTAEHGKIITHTNNGHSDKHWFQNKRKKTITFWLIQIKINWSWRSSLERAQNSDHKYLRKWSQKITGHLLNLIMSTSSWEWTCS